MHSAYVRLRDYAERRPVENQEAFLMKTARNISIDWSRQRERVAGQPVELLCIDMAEPVPLQDEILEMRNRLHHIEQCLAELPARTRLIFEMHRLDGLKYREIASILQISQSTVEKNIARAAASLGRWARDW